MVKGLLKRLFPVLCCIVILISCLVVPASAMSPWVDGTNDHGQYVRPDIGYSMILSGPFDNDVQFTTSLRGLDFCYHYGSAMTSWQTAVLARPSKPNFGGSESELAQWHVVHKYRVPYTSVDDNDVWRVLEEFQIVNDAQNPGITSNCMIFLDDFGGSYDRDQLASMFWVVGQFSYVVSGTFYSINDHGELVVYPFEFPMFHSNGNQSIFTGNYLNHFEQKANAVAGQPYFVSDLSVRFYSISGNISVSRSAIATPDDIVSLDSNRFTSLRQFLSSNSLETGYGDSFLEGESITDFLAGAASSVLDAKLFGDYTLGGILAVLLAVAIVFWLMKIFAGG